VFVIFIFLGVVFISIIGSIQAGSAELLLDETTPSPTPTATPDPHYYFPVIKNHYDFLYSRVVLSNGQGFDNCKPLSVQGMQNWWDNSPYSAVNIYLGGISALCPFDELGYEWYAQVAEQGWSFILTWAGPQAPKGCPEDCKFRFPMSTDPEIAYLEGKIEALAAVEAAENAGFKGQLVLYYDIESYSGADDETRATVASFIKGWTEQLHELKHIAGAYGAACTSYVVDWAFNDPPLDEVWVAQWNKEYAYDPDATVYNTTCLDVPGQPPIFWINHQRLKQYTGPHNETWGDLTVKIDSDVLDGAVNALFGQPPEKIFQPGSSHQAAPPMTVSSGPDINDFKLLSPSYGWVLRENQLLWTADGGKSWRDISPGTNDQNYIIGVHFENQDQGWLASRKTADDGTLSMSIYRTQNAGETWDETLLDEFNPSDTWEIETGAFEFLDGDVGWLALKLHSGNNFSFGRLLATEDGGRTWQERKLPLGEPVIFLDAQNGWTAGGPLEQVFHTEDGGQSWTLSKDQSAEDIEALPSNNLHSQVVEMPLGAVSLDSLNNQIAWAIIQEGTCSGYKPRAGEQMPPDEEPLECMTSSRFVKTVDGGLSWDVISLPK
jgi:hypothetical protein